MTLAVEQITFTYPMQKEAILQEVSMDFPLGEVVAVTGANGCGKTTLTKLLVGILRPQFGGISLDGINIAGWSLAEIGRQVGYCFQNPAQQMFCTTVEEEIAYGLKNQNLPDNEIQACVSYYLNYFQLERHRKAFPLHLSQGEKQRLMLAAILSMRPRYIILDEPTTGLDGYRQHLLGECLKSIQFETKCGIIFVSHDQSFIRKYADREVVLKG